MRVAGIDCGTNSIRLLVADLDPVAATLTDVVRLMEVVRLGQGVDKTGRLAPEALARGQAGEASAVVRERVQRARAAQARVAQTLRALRFIRAGRFGGGI